MTKGLGRRVVLVAAAVAVNQESLIQDMIDPSTGPLPDSVSASWRHLQEALSDRYVIERETGKGAMGTVFKAHDIKHDRAIALKVLREDAALSIGAERFKREILTAARLVHPNIVAVFDSGSLGENLYYVMPFIRGESLRSRLDREGALPADDAVEIGCQLLSALDYAHKAGVIHRDIKPENILLTSDGHAWLTDFGVARAVEDAYARVTQTGMILGSPLYISPEQANSANVDGRADIYSLGCVLYEMLTSSPPFHGQTLEAVLVGHFTESVKPVAAVRASVSTRVSDVIARMMAKNRHDRFGSAAEVLAALRGKAPVRIRKRARSTNGKAAAVAIVMLTLGAYAVSNGRYRQFVSAFNARPVLDTTRYAVFAASADGAEEAVTAQLADAIGEWSGVDVVDNNDSHLAFLKTRGRLTRKSRRKIASTVTAGRLVAVKTTNESDLVHYVFSLYDGNGDRTLARVNATLPARSPPNSTLKEAAKALLFHGVKRDCLTGEAPSSSIQIIRGCDRALRSVAAGRIEEADSILSSLLRIDSRYGRGSLWLAIVRGWLADQVADVRPLTLIASATAFRLTDRERTYLSAESEMQAGRFPEACRLYRDLIQSDSLDYVAWLGNGECIRRDHLVLRDPRSPTGWSFRSSYNEALNAYQASFQINPSLLGGFRERSFRRVRGALLTTNDLREGGRAGEVRTFQGTPVIQGDTVAIVALSTRDVGFARVPSLVAGMTDVYERQRSVFADLMRNWITHDPRNITALEGLSVAQLMASDPQAIATIREAHSLSKDEHHRLELAASEVWANVQFGTPDRTDMLRRARVLADSIVHNSEPATSSDAKVLARLGALLGDGVFAAAMLRMTAPDLAAELRIPIAVARPALAILAFAAVGGPPDSLAALEREFDAAITNAAARSKQHDYKLWLLTQPSMIAFPYRMAALDDVAEAGVYTNAALAFLNGDTVPARQMFRRLKQYRRYSRPSDLTPDALLLEAQMLRMMGHPQEAVAHIDPTLNAVRWYEPGWLQDVALAGTFVRLVLLRVDLARQLNAPSDADRWERALSSLTNLQDKTTKKR